MESLSNLATVARNSIYGEEAPTSRTTQSTIEPPSGGVPGKGTPDAPYDPGNVPEQVPTQPGVEPPSGGPPGKGTADSPFDPGNEPEQIQISGAKEETTNTTSPPSSSTPASKINNPDPSNSSDMKSALASHDARNRAKPTSKPPPPPSSSPPKKTPAAKATSHSALFGLGPEAENNDDNNKHHDPPKPAAPLPKETTKNTSASVTSGTSGELSGPISQAGEAMARHAEMEKRGMSEDETGGYVGLKKAAEEEKEKEKDSNSNGNGFGDWGKKKGAADGEERTSRSMDHRNSSLGREISPGEMPDGTHRRSIAEGATSHSGMPSGHHFGRRTTTGSNMEGGEKSGGGFREKLKDKFRSKK